MIEQQTFLTGITLMSNHYDRLPGTVCLKHLEGIFGHSANDRAISTTCQDNHSRKPLLSHCQRTRGSDQAQSRSTSFGGVGAVC